MLPDVDTYQEHLWTAAQEQIQALGLDGLIVIGGNGSLTVTSKLYDDLRLPLVGVPKTIDNDVVGTDATFGFQTAVQIAESAYNRLLGRPLTQPVVIDEIAISPADLATLDTGRTRAEVTALIRQTEALRAQSDAARAQGGPQVLLSAGFNQMDNRYLAKEGLWNVAVGLHWSLFDGGVYSSQADASRWASGILAIHCSTVCRRPLPSMAAASRPISPRA